MIDFDKVLQQRIESLRAQVVFFEQHIADLQFARQAILQVQLEINVLRQQLEAQDGNKELDVSK